MKTSRFSKIKFVFGIMLSVAPFWRVSLECKMCTLLYISLETGMSILRRFTLIVTQTAHPCGPADTEEYIHHQLELPNCSHLLQCSFLNHFLKTSDIMFCVSLIIFIGHKQCDSYRTARHVLFFKQFNKQEVNIEELRVYTYCQLLSLCLLHQ